MLSGMLCGPRAFHRAEWIGHFSGDDDISAYAGADVSALLEQVCATTVAALDSDELQFTLLLPADSNAVVERAAAFAAWCRGFLSGFGLSGVTDLAVLGEDARGFLNDVARFGAIAIDGRNAEDDERALVELVEFTRMGVMIIYAETRTMGASPPPSLH